MGICSDNMIVKQLSVFLENKTGRLNHVAKILGEAGINMTAFSVADNSDFGILRVIVHEPERAAQILREHLFAVSLTDVICLKISNKAGSLSSVLSILEKEDIYIEYMYAFSEGDDANVVIRPDKLEACLSALKKNNIEMWNREQIV